MGVLMLFRREYRIHVRENDISCILAGLSEIVLPIKHFTIRTDSLTKPSSYDPDLRSR